MLDGAGSEARSEEVSRRDVVGNRDRERRDWHRDDREAGSDVWVSADELHFPLNVDNDVLIVSAAEVGASTKKKGILSFAKSKITDAQAPYFLRRGNVVSSLALISFFCRTWG